MKNIVGLVSVVKLNMSVLVSRYFQVIVIVEIAKKSSGSGYVPVLIFTEDTIKITGNPKFYEKLGDSGKKIERGFCTQCGSTVFGKLEVIPNAISVRAGTLNNPHSYQPKFDFYTSSSNHWDFMNENIPKLKKSIREG